LSCFFSIHSTANIVAGSLNYGGIKCEDQNGGTASAGDIRSDSSSIIIQGFKVLMTRSIFAGTI
jgi:hypothetical protein